jgi:hypothetical protein
LLLLLTETTCLEATTCVGTKATDASVDGKAATYSSSTASFHSRVVLGSKLFYRLLLVLFHGGNDENLVVDFPTLRSFREYCLPKGNIHCSNSLRLCTKSTSYPNWLGKWGALLRSKSTARWSAEKARSLLLSRLLTEGRGFLLLSTKA